MNKELLARESNLARISNSSCSFWTNAEERITFPEQLAGKIVIDICGGASDAVLELRRRGAIAVSVDFMYGNLKGLKKKVDAGLNDFRSMTADKPDLLVPARISSTEKDSQPVTYNTLIKHMRKARNAFFDSVNRGDGIYLTGLASYLPFKDNSVDFAFSIEGISGILVKQPELLLCAVSEAVRVLKPGAELRLYSWANPVWTKDEISNALLLVSFLEASGIPFVSQEAHLCSRLVIKKPL